MPNGSLVSGSKILMILALIPYGFVFGVYPRKCIRIIRVPDAMNKWRKGVLSVILGAFLQVSNAKHDAENNSD